MTDYYIVNRKRRTESGIITTSRKIPKKANPFNWADKTERPKSRRTLGAIIMPIAFRMLIKSSVFILAVYLFLSTVF